MLWLAVVLLAPEAITLARQGQAVPPIVVAADAIPSERTAAKELADYLGRAAGATFRVVDEPAAPAGPAILVGPTTVAKRRGLLPPGAEAWRYVTVDGSLLICGGRPRGTLYGVYQFLEHEVGVRWWTPWDEFVPRRPELGVGLLDRAGAPRFDYRDIYDELPEPKVFQARNRVNGHFSGLRSEHGGTLAYGPPYHVHTFNLYFPPGQHFAAHPEWYSLRGGKRQAEQSQLCLTNPALRAALIAKVRDHMAQSAAAAERAGVPPPAVYSVSQNDWYGQCECPTCTALVQREGSEMGPLLDCVNAIADAVKDDFPWAFIDTLAYQYTITPPKTLRPRQNVIIRLCDLNDPDQAQPLSHPNNQHFHDLVEQWAAIAPHLRVWDYAVTYGDHHGLPYPSLRTMAPDYRFLLEHRTTGMFVEHEYPVTGDLRDLKTWVQMKLLEDPYQDPEALITDFTDGFYGAAGPLVREYLTLLEQAVVRTPARVSAFGGAKALRYLDREFVTAAQALFDRAERLVGGDAVRLARLRHARLPLDRATLYRWRELNREAAVELDPAAVAARATAVIQAEATRRMGGPRGEQFAQQHATILQSLAKIPARAPLPARFAGLPRERLIDLTPDSFRLWANQAKVVADPLAELGVTARLLMSDTTADQRREEYRVNAERGLPWGFYDTASKQTVAATTVPATEFTGPGYHWLKLAPVELTATCYIYFFWSWVIQADVDAPPGRYEAWAQVRLTGPWFPHPQPGDADAISVARVILVRQP
ncbi:MAG: DUF4838 domain-containing protein [Fimbriimonadaceae bacterium]|nr:DUF4838 domain-containing protein [Fimbriimonadaceae bacterium]